MMWSSLLSFVLSQWFLLAAAAAYLVWRRLWAPYTFFAKRGIPFMKPWPIVGNSWRIMTQQITMFDTVLSGYNEFKGKRLYGTFDFKRPLLNITDPELIRQITIKDFDHFVDHRPVLDDIGQAPLFFKSLVMLTGQKWRDMRATLSPAFTGSKMRQMFRLMSECCEQTTQTLVDEAKASDEPYVPEMKDLFSRLASNVIATTAFGVQANATRDRNDRFYAMGRSVMALCDVWTVAKIGLIVFAPKIAQWAGVKMFRKEQTDFYHSLVHDTMRHREENGIVRPDMIQLLMEARKGVLKSALSTSEDAAGFAAVDEVHAETLNGQQKTVWDDDDLTAQCFLFFLAGFESVAVLLCFAAHEIMENPDVQRKLIAELDEAKEQLQGKPIAYEQLLQLKYLDMVVSETLRKWPPGVITDRVCQKPYRLIDPETGHSVLTLQEGDVVTIPVVGIHRDAQHYADPERFDPERFSDERKGEIKPFTYLPFGAGPRNCIASRFALMECKAVLFYLLTNFTFEVAPTTTSPIVLVPDNFSFKAKDGFNVHLKPRW